MTFMTRRSAAICLATGAALIAAPPALHAQAYPTKPVTIVVPFAAGGDADRSARNLGAFAQGLLKQPVVIVNKAGASGAIGSQAVKDAAPDGYTLLLARVGSNAVLPALRPGLPYQWNDFTFIGLLELNPVVCVVHPDSKYRTLKDQIQGSKLRALVTTTPERVKEIPDVPTAREIGFPQLEAIVGWSALYGPPKMSPEALQRWTDVLKQAAADPGWLEGNERYGGIPQVLPPAETEKFIATRFEAHSKLGQQLGIQLK